MKTTTLLIFVLAASAKAASWAPGIVTFEVNLAPYNSVVSFELNQWNNYTNKTHLRAVNAPNMSFGHLDGHNEIDWSANANWNYVFPANTLAISLVYFNGPTMLEADVLVNSAEPWGSYTGNLEPGLFDIGRVMLHELGHSIGLEHSSLDTIMSPYTNNLFTLTDGDIRAVETLYGVPKQTVPENGTAAAFLGLGLLSLVGYHYHQKG